MITATTTKAKKTPSPIAKAEDLLNGAMVWGIGALMTRRPQHALCSAVAAARVLSVLRSVPTSRRVAMLRDAAAGIRAKQSAAFLSLRAGATVSQ